MHRAATVNAQGRTVNAQGRTVNAQGRTVNAQGRTVNAQGRTVNAQGRTVNAGPYGQCKAAVNAGPYGQCRAVRSMQGRSVNARPYGQCQCTRPYGQCRAVRSMQGRAVNAQGRAVNAQGRTVKAQGRTVNAQGRTVNEQSRTVNAQGRTPTRPYAQCIGPYARCRAVRSMRRAVRSVQGRTPNAGPHGQCRAGGWTAERTSGGVSKRQPETRQNLTCNGSHQPQHARTGSPRQHLATPSLRPETTQTTSQQLQLKILAHLRLQAMRARTCKTCGTERALAAAKVGKKWAVSDDQRPPTSPAMTHQAGTTAYSDQFRIDPLFATSGLPQGHSVPYCGSGSGRAVLTDR